jgi:hypothetical protein
LVAGCLLAGAATCFNAATPGINKGSELISEAVAEASFST